MNFFISAPTCETASLLHRGGCQSKSHLSLFANGSLTRRIGLRPSDARPGDAARGRQGGGAGGQMQKISAGKLHRLSMPPGRNTVNTEPLPGLLVTVTSPPIMRASLREMARPSPVPP